MLQAVARALAAVSVASAVSTFGISPAVAADAPDTTPCGPVEDYHPWDWWRTTTEPQIARTIASTADGEHWRWRDDVNALWRGDTRENVEDIFRAGFTPRGEAVIPLNEYIVKGGGQNSAHLSTSCEQWVAQRFATYGAAKTGWVYEIYAPGGIDVNATARLDGYQSPYLWNKEIDFPGGIEGRYIKGACKYRLLRTDPDTRVNTYENLGCKSNPDFAPYKAEAAAPASAAPAGAQSLTPATNSSAAA